MSHCLGFRFLLSWPILVRVELFFIRSYDGRRFLKYILILARPLILRNDLSHFLLFTLLTTIDTNFLDISSILTTTSVMITSSKKSRVFYERVEKEDQRHHDTAAANGLKMQGLEMEASDEEVEIEDSDEEVEMYGSMPEVIHGSFDDGKNHGRGGTLFRTFRARCCTPKIACLLSISILCIVALSISSNNHPKHGSDMPLKSPPSSPGGDVGSDNTGPKEDETSWPSKRERDVIHRLSLVSGMSVSTAGTPQHKATHWILKEDSLSLRANNPYLLQRYFLALLYYKMEGADKINKGLNKKMEHLEFWMDGLIHECQWERVGCNGDGFIESLKLDNCGLTGPLPPEIYVLPKLLELDFSNNYLTGPLPSELQNLEDLIELYLEGNDLHGQVPPYICHRRAEGPLKKVTTDCYEYGDAKVWCNCCDNCAPTDMYDFMELDGDGSPYGDGLQYDSSEKDDKFILRKEKINGKCVQLTEGSASVMRTPQHEAMIWMIFEDKYYLDSESEKFLQRYVALILHFTFDKQSYLSTSKDECSINWIECDEVGRIIGLSFCEYLIIGIYSHKA